MTSLVATASTHARRRPIAVLTVLALLVGVVLPILVGKPASGIEGVTTVSISDAQALEGGDVDITGYTFTVTLNTPALETIEVDYEVVGVTASEGSDYTEPPLPHTVTFELGDDTAEITVLVSGDDKPEPNETFTVNLTPADDNVTVVDADEDGDTYGLGTIINDDLAPTTIAIADVTVTEGNAGTTSAVFTITQSSDQNPQAVTLQWTTTAATGAGAASAGSDYTTNGGTVTIPAEDDTATVTVVVLGDTLDEPNELFHVDLSNATNALIADSRANGTITDDDPLPALSISDAAVTETEVDITASFNVTISNASSQAVTANWATTAGTATATADYTTASGTVTFAAGTTTQQTINVTVEGDTLDEALTETFTVTLTNPANGTCAGGDCQATGTITDNDGEPAISIDDVTVTEGNSGTVSADFTVSLTTPSGKSVDVDYTTAAGTTNPATAGSDYAARSGTVTFAPGDDDETIAVPVNGDTLDEVAETFKVVLSNALNATIADGEGIGTITDDDAIPTVTIGNVTVTEADSTGSTTTPVTSTFPVTLSAPSGQTITLTYTTGATGDTATGGSDYTGTTNGSLTFVPGDTQEDISIPVLGDNTVEGHEFFTVTVTSGATASCSGGSADCSGKGTITDDEAPSLTVDNAAGTEADAGTTTQMVFTVRMSTAIAGQDVHFSYATADKSAEAGADYEETEGTGTGITTGPGTIARGQTTTTISVPIRGDNFVEPLELFALNISAPDVAVIGDSQGIGSITDDEPGEPTTISIDDVTVSEGVAGGTVTFTLTQTGTNLQTARVNYATANGTAEEPADYTAKTDTVEFLPGEDEKDIDIDIVNDTADELDQTFFVNLTDGSNAEIVKSQGRATIDDNDGPVISVTDPTVTEGNTGTVTAAFIVGLSAPSVQPVSVDYTTQPLTTPEATEGAGNDYLDNTGTLTFPAGNGAAQTVSVTVNGDTTDEINERFHLKLSNAVDAAMPDDTGVGTITDDDGPTISVGDVTVTEGDSGTVNAVFSVSLSAASPQVVTVDYATADDTAIQPGDYTAGSGTLTFPASSTTAQTVTVPVKGDTVDEVDETFKVNLSNPSQATIADGLGVGTITDDDGPTISVADTSVTEGNSGTVNAVFSVTLSSASPQPVSVDYTTEPLATPEATEGAGNDYLDNTGTVTFPANSTTAQTVSVIVNGDTLDETNERFRLVLDDPVDATIADGEGIGTITDNDGPGLAVTDVSVTEGFSGTVDAVFSVSLSAASQQSVSVDYATANDTAIQPGDYTAGSGTLTFPASSTTAQTVTVPVKGDTLDEINETFKLILSNAVNADIADGEGVGTINDDDTPPSVSIGDASIPEADDQDVVATFDVTLSTESGQTVTVDYATDDGDAIAGEDYDENAGTVTFPPGVRNRTIEVTILGDNDVEEDEVYFVDLFDPVNASLDQETGEGIIENDDEPDITPPPPPAPKQGYWMTAGDGGIFSFGESANHFYGSQGGKPLNQPVVGMESTASGNGYWQVASDGGVFSYGPDAVFHGSMGGMTLNAPVVGMERTASGNGYWLVASDGGIFSFGDAQSHFYGSQGGKPLNAPVVGMERTASGNGYWLVASDGGIFSFGDAQSHFYGSQGGKPLNKPVVGMARTPTGNGYWLVASDGGIFSFGDAQTRFYGSMGGRSISAPIVGMATTPTGEGYWMVGSDGAVYRFGDARFLGSMAGKPLNKPVVGMAAFPG